MQNLLSNELSRGVIQAAKAKLRPPSPCRPRLQEQDMLQDSLLQTRGSSAMCRMSRQDTRTQDQPKAAAKRSSSLPLRPATTVQSALPSMCRGYSTQLYGSTGCDPVTFTGIMHSDLSPREVESFLQAKPFEDIPGPTAIYQSIPFASTRLLYYPFSSFKTENLGDMLSRLQTLYGPTFRVKIGAEWVVLVENMADIDRVVRSAELEEDRGIRPPVPPKGLFGFTKRVDDPCMSWLKGGYSYSKKIREAIASHVSSFSVVTESLKEQERIANDFISNLQQVQDSPVEVQKLCARYAYESVGQTCFTQRLGLLSENYCSDGERQKLLESYQTVVRCLSETMTGTRVLHHLFEDRFAKRFREAKKTVQAWERELMREATRTRTREGGSAASEKSLLVSLMKEKTLGEQEILDAMHSIVTSGGDLISNALQLMLYSLAINPAKQEKLYAEMEKALGKDFQVDAINLGSCEYLTGAIKESLRMNFPFSAGGRVSLSSNIVLDNYFIPAGTQIVVNSRRTAKNPVWFDHPQLFMPERWLGEEGERIPPQAFMPFGFSSSLCPTSNFALEKFQLALIKILQRFKVELPSKYQESRLETVYTPFRAPKEPLPFSFVPRDHPAGKSDSSGQALKGFPGIPPK